MVAFITMPARKLLFMGFMLLGLTGMAQFPPPAGESGSTAIRFDSSCFKFWANGCSVLRGFINIADTTIAYQGKNHATFGSETDGTGSPDEMVVSLGDGGVALLTFPVHIGNGPGFDFVIFENALNNTFLELGLVEVSSDGIRFVRFPAVSLTTDTVQVPFVGGSVDATKINNLAGKYRATYGTPFDLVDIQDSTGIDLNNINFVRIMDAVGCIQSPYATYDSQGHRINDPWPTPFNTGGFDLDAVGIINISAQAAGNETNPFPLLIYPNPADDLLTVSCEYSDFSFSIWSTDGKIIQTGIPVNHSGTIRIADLRPGLYLGKARFPDGSVSMKKVMVK